MVSKKKVLTHSKAIFWLSSDMLHDFGKENTSSCMKSKNTNVFLQNNEYLKF